MLFFQCIDFYCMYVPSGRFLPPVIVGCHKVLIIFCREDEACFNYCTSMNVFMHFLYYFSEDWVLRKVPFGEILLTKVKVLLCFFSHFPGTCVMKTLNFISEGLCQIFRAAVYKADRVLCWEKSGLWFHLMLYWSVIIPCVWSMDMKGLLLSKLFSTSRCFWPFPIIKAERILVW